MTGIRIIGTGHFVPGRVVTNDELARHMDTSDQWIRERSGISERRWIEPGQSNVQMCLEASGQALAAADLDPSAIDMIICASITPDFHFPGNSALLQHALGLERTIAAMDIRNQCTGFIYGLTTAAAYIKTGLARTILLLGSEIQSTALDLSDRGRDMTVLFGDGAGAVILQADDSGSDLLASSLHSQGEFAKDLWCEMPSSLIPGRINAQVMAEGRHHPKMDGRLVFKHAIRRFSEAIEEVLEKAGLGIEDIRLLVPHQANQRITDQVTHRFGLKPEQVVSNIHKYGNTTAASIPIALDEAVREGRLQRGDHLILVAFGSGFTWGANLLRW